MTEIITASSTTVAGKPKRNGHEKTVTNPKGAGRPKGQKNHITLLKEAIMEESQGVILKHFPKIVKAVCVQAEKGDVRAAKLIMDRIIPVKRSVDDMDRGTAGGITIVVQGSGHPKISALAEGKPTETIEVINDE